MAKKLIVSLAFCFCFFIIAGCSVQVSKGPVLVEINHKDISVQEGVFYLRLTEAQFVQRGSEDIWKTPFDGRSAEEVAKEVALNTVIKTNVLAQQAEEYNVSLTAEEQQSVVDQSTRIFADHQEKNFSKDNITLEDVKSYVRKLILGSKVNNQLANPVYENQLKQDSVEEEINSIIESAKKENTELTITSLFINEGEVELLKKIKNKMKEHSITQEDFQLLIDEYGNSTTVQTKVLYAKNDDESYEKSIFDSKKDEILLIQVDDGYQFIYIVDKVSLTEEQEKEVYDNARKEIENQLFNKSLSLAYDSILSKSDVKIYEEEWKKVKIRGKE